MWPFTLETVPHPCCSLPSKQPMRQLQKCLLSRAPIPSFLVEQEPKPHSLTESVVLTPVAVTSFFSTSPFVSFLISQLEEPPCPPVLQELRLPTVPTWGVPDAWPRPPSQAFPPHAAARAAFARALLLPTKSCAFLKTQLRCRLLCAAFFSLSR